MNHRTPPPNTLTPLDLLSLVLVLALGAMHLAYPFDGDQAMFNQATLKMSQGAVLYRDFWDVKQPGIFFFYWLGGVLFGFNEVGIHLLELLYMLAFAVCLLLTFKSCFHNARITSLIPLFTVGMFYTAGSVWHLTQVESLSGFLLLGLLVTAIASAKSQTAGRTVALAAASGLLGGLLLLLKIIFIPLLGALWLVALLFSQSEWRWPKSAQLGAWLLHYALPICVGALLPNLIVLAYFSSLNLLDLIIYDFIEWPVQAIAVLPYRTFAHLISNASWLFIGFAPTLILTLVWATRALKNRPQPRRPDPLLAGLITWLIVGLTVVLIQRLSWLEYHYALFFAPLGVLGALGLDGLWRGLKNQQGQQSAHTKSLLLMGGVLILFLFSLATLAAKVVRFATHSFTLTPQSRRSYQTALSPDYAVVVREVQPYLAARAQAPERHRTLLIVGHPLYYQFAGIPPTLTSNGWAIEQFLPAQWQLLRDELQANPPDNIFVTTQYNFDKIFAAHAADIDDIVDKKYKVLSKSDAGTWYTHR